PHPGFAREQVSTGAVRERADEGTERAGRADVPVDPLQVQFAGQRPAVLDGDHRLHAGPTEVVEVLRGDSHRVGPPAGVHPDLARVVRGGRAEVPVDDSYPARVEDLAT